MKKGNFVCDYLTSFPLILSLQEIGEEHKQCCKKVEYSTFLNLIKDSSCRNLFKIRSQNLIKLCIYKNSLVFQRLYFLN